VERNEGDTPVITLDSSCCRTARIMGAIRCPACNGRIESPVVVTITMETVQHAYLRVNLLAERMWVTDTDLCLRREHGAVDMFPLAQVLGFKVRDV
jgi:hypothetical protein